MNEVDGEARRPRSPGDTRRRIIEATVALHEEVGPAATTIAGIAERAGVQRLTVYRHLPDERTLIGACSAHWSAGHPLPDASGWVGLADPTERVRTALREIYGYYERGSRMLEKVLRDEPEVPALAEVMAPVHAWFRELAGQLSAGWGTSGRDQRLVRALIGHALDFDTWRSLAEQGLGYEEAADLMTRAIASIATSSRSP